MVSNDLLQKKRSPVVNESIKREIRRVLIVLIVSLLISWWLESLWPAVIAPFAWWIYNVLQSARVFQWIDRYPKEWEPPEGSGLWSDLMNELYRLLRKENRTRDELTWLIRRTESSLSALRDGVVVLDRRQRLETWNKAAAQALGLRKSTDYQQTFTNFVRNPKMAEYLSNEDFEHALVLPGPSRQHHCMLEYTVTRFGEGEYFLLIRDVTRLHKLEQMRNDFVANVSHELKTPLTVFNGYLEMLIDNRESQPELLDLAVQRMSEQTQKMTELIVDLLFLARLENTQVQSDQKPVEMLELIEDLVRDGAIIAEQKKHHIHVEIPKNLCLIGDQTELQCAFTNLLVNAVKYTPEDGKIEIVWTFNEEGGVLAFRDNGPGIATHHLPRLTERFYRPNTGPSSQAKGTGLGLAIVKHVLLRHDAHLDIESIVGQGSVFQCQFPQSRIYDESLQPEIIEHA